VLHPRNPTRKIGVRVPTAVRSRPPPTSAVLRPGSCAEHEARMALPRIAPTIAKVIDDEFASHAL
jgi:hypothetical protein